MRIGSQKGLAPATMDYKALLEEDRQADVRRAQYELLLFLVIGQLVLNLALSGVWWYLGGPWGPLIFGFSVAAGTAAILDWVIVRKIRSNKQPLVEDSPSSTLPWWLLAVGLVSSLFPLVLFSGFLHLAWQNRWFTSVVALLVGGLLFLAIGERNRNRGYVSLALLLAPAVLGWLSASLALSYVSSADTIATWYWKTVSTEKAQSTTPALARCSTGSKSEEPIRVAVALSGGGYRAALTHAGLLTALDEQCVRIDLLTTVSGGSIIGAAYALGIPPVEFAQHLAQKTPGLATDMVLNVFSLFQDLILPPPSHIQRNHFRRAFYGDARLKDLPDVPLLLVNATDLEVESYAAREVFFKGRAPAAAVDGKSLDETILVADVVGASGAYPGPFQPVTVPWVVNSEEPDLNTVKARRFVDGGVYENFGVEGLRRYLTLRKANGTLPAKPQLLIISDAGGYGTPGALRPRVDIVTLLSKSQSVAYEVFHRDLYVRYTGVREPLSWITKEPVSMQTGLVSYAGIDPELKEGAPMELVSVAMPMTAMAMESVLKRYPRCLFADKETETAAEIQHKVRGFTTLSELSPTQVRQAFWLGYVIGTVYKPAIDCAKIRIAGGTCPLTTLEEELLRDTTITCPSFSDLVRRYDEKRSTN